MIVWTGKGILSVLVVFFSIVAFNFILPRDLSDYSFALGFFIGAIFSFYFGLKWNSQEAERVFVDEKTGEKVRVKNNHSLFWIKMEYWGLIFAIFGIIILFQNSVWVGLTSILVLAIIGFVFFLNFKKANKVDKKQINEIFKEVIDQNVKETPKQEEIEVQKKEDDWSRYMPKSNKSETENK